MCRCQVFVVNRKTFPYHLKYLFAGTTAGKGRDDKYKDRHVGLLADISRVRKGDKIVFYLEEVGFFGIFEADSEYPSYEPPEKGFLQQELGVPLIYRVRVRPAEVFAKPVSEWEAIEKLPEKSREIRWSLLYRKLKGKRGCSYLFPNEAESLLNLIRDQNSHSPIIADQGECYTFDESSMTISIIKVANEYKSSNISPKDHIRLGASESDLQAWICWHLQRHPVLEPIAPSRSLQWFANEVYAGVGTQKMDILCILNIGDCREFRVLELKNKKPNTKELVAQTQRYVRWLDSYQREPSDKVKVFWISRDFDKDAEKGAEKLIEEEKIKGLTAVELLTWKPTEDNITLTRYRDLSAIDQLPMVYMV